MRIAFWFRDQRDEAPSLCEEMRILDAHDATDERTFGAAWENEKNAFMYMSLCRLVPLRKM